MKQFPKDTEKLILFSSVLFSLKTKTKNNLKGYPYIYTHMYQQKYRLQTEE